MFIGIKNLAGKLQELQSESVYFLAASDRDIAINLALSCLYHNSQKNNQNYLILGDVEKDSLLSQGFKKEFLLDVDAQVLKSKGHNNVLKTLIRDLHLMNATKEMSMFVFLLDQISFLPYEDKNLDKLLSSFSIFASRYNACMLFITFGENPENLLTKLSRKFHYITGLASASKHDEKIIYSSKVWRNSDGEFSSGKHEIKLNPDGYELVVDAHDTTSAVDHNICYMHREAFDPDRFLFSATISFSDNLSLYENAVDNAVTAMIFFCVNSDYDIDSVGEYIYDLRTKCGKFLKIFVVEKYDSISATARSFFLRCGANFTFPSSASSSYINAMLPALQSAVFNRPIYGTFQSMLDLYHMTKNESRGYLEPQKFIEKVSSIIVPHLNNDNIKAALVTLTLKDNLSIKECINRFKPRADGCYCTEDCGKIVLFLPACTRDLLCTVIEHMFYSDPKDMFKGCDAVYTKNEILNRAITIGTVRTETDAEVSDLPSCMEK